MKKLKAIVFYKNGKVLKMHNTTEMKVRRYNFNREWKYANLYQNGTYLKRIYP